MKNQNPVTPIAASALIDDAVDRDQALELTVDESWLQGRSWYGGIQLALAVKAARRALGRNDPIRSLHATFIGPVGQDAPAAASAEIIRAGRSVTHMRSSVRQGDNICFECTAIFGATRDTEATHDSDAATDLDPEKASRFPFMPGLTPNCIQHYDMRWGRGKPPFSATDDPRATIFAKPAAAGATYDETEFLALTDVIPPPVISVMKTPSPVSSMNVALELIRPEVIYGTRQFVRFESELHDTHSGYAWQTARMYDEKGTLLAIAHQSVAVFG